MNEKNKPDQYVEHLNRHILPHIDYDKLQVSYDTDMVYAKGILNRLHEAMVSVYGGELLDEADGDEGVVVIPGIVRGRNNGKLCLALLDLDLSSSGEHWGTAFLCESGVISQNEAFSNQAGASEMKEAIKAYVPYDYCYTAVIPDDIHVDTMRLPIELVTLLNDFRNHKAVLTNEQEARGKCDPPKAQGAASGEKPSVLDKIREAAKEPPKPKENKPSHDKSQPEH